MFQADQAFLPGLLIRSIIDFDVNWDESNRLCVKCDRGGELVFFCSERVLNCTSYIHFNIYAYGASNR